MPRPPPRVLIVEDDPNVSEVVARYLEREGYHVERVATAPSASIGRWPSSRIWSCST